MNTTPLAFGCDGANVNSLKSYQTPLFEVRMIKIRKQVLLTGSPNEIGDGDVDDEFEM